ncbi:MAG: hypothetical protein FWG00_02775 [Coriobacteriia bacterium]|nr:hypothetical protein [Coriobacteriia bacterium]
MKQTTHKRINIISLWVTTVLLTIVVTLQIVFGFLSPYDIPLSVIIIVLCMCAIALSMWVTTVLVTFGKGKLAQFLRGENRRR